jgi:hypothetical protein
MTPKEFIEHLREKEIGHAGIIYGYDFPAFIEENGYDRKLNINPFTIEIVIKSWIDDLEKYSQYHISAPDDYKQAAFLMHWISKLKPIPLSLGSHLETKRCQHPLLKLEKYGMVNEIFAVQLGLARVKIDYKQAYAKYPKVIKELVYQLYYRDVNPKQLYTTLEFLHVAHLSSLYEFSHGFNLVRENTWRIEDAR